MPPSTVPDTRKGWYTGPGGHPQATPGIQSSQQVPWEVPSRELASGYRGRPRTTHP